MNLKRNSSKQRENRFPSIAERRREHKDVPYEILKNGEDFNSLRFRADWGPESLFHRIRVKFKNRKLVEFNVHGTERYTERQIDPHIISEATNFEPREWELIQAAVSPKTYKFVTTTWERRFGKDRIWLIIGMYHQIVSIYYKDGTGYGQDNIINKENPIYQIVDEVNSDLNRQDGI